MNLKYKLWIITVESIDNSTWLCYNSSIQGIELVEVWILKKFSKKLG